MQSFPLHSSLLSLNTRLPLSPPLPLTISLCVWARNVISAPAVGIVTNMCQLLPACGHYTFWRMYDACCMSCCQLVAIIHFEECMMLVVWARNVISAPAVGIVTNMCQLLPACGHYTFWRMYDACCMSCCQLVAIIHFEECMMLFFGYFFNLSKIS